MGRLQEGGLGGWEEAGEVDMYGTSFTSCSHFQLFEFFIY